jgi:GLPGLI family protein
MKALFTFLACFFSVVFYSQNLSGKVTYVISMEPISKKRIDSLSKKLSTKKVKMDKWMRDILKNTPDITAYLEFTNSESLYKVEDKMKNDGKISFNINRTFAGGDDRYYKNTKTKEYFQENGTLGELMLIEIEPKKWQITQASKKIGNYLCYKAIDFESTNKKMKPVVWFTPQIPVSFGPKEYNGLPGLVLLVEMSNRTISASQIVLNPKKEIRIEKPIKGKKMTAKESREKGAALWKRIEKQ